jgi:hypothetical protein
LVVKFPGFGVVGGGDLDMDNITLGHGFLLLGLDKIIGQIAPLL